MRYGFACALIATVVCSWTGAARAADWDRPPPLPDDRRGPIVGIHWVYALNDYHFNQSGVSAADALGFEVLGGYRFNRWVDLTGVFQYQSNFAINGSALVIGGVPIRGDACAWNISFMPTVRVYPFATLLPPWVEPYGLYGMGTMYEEIDDGVSSDSDATFMFRFETGVDFHVMPELVIKIGAGYVVAAEDLQLLGLDVTPNYAPFVAGVEYRF
jgi:hypothetical protein